MLVLGIETSCDETGVALYDGTQRRLLAHAVHSQVAMHEAYGGVVPELASRDHIQPLVRLPRAVLASGDVGFSFSGLKTAALMLVKQQGNPADIARAFVDAVVEVLVAKCVRALQANSLTRLVVAGGVGANKQLRAALDAEAKKRGFDVFYPEPELCTDNGAMIAFAAAQRLDSRTASAQHSFSVKPRWAL